MKRRPLARSLAPLATLKVDLGWKEERRVLRDLVASEGWVVAAVVVVVVGGGDNHPPALDGINDSPKLLSDNK